MEIEPEDEAYEIEDARHQAKRARVMSILWWVQVPLITLVYWVVSSQPGIEKAILIYLADVSIIANAVSYSSKAQASLARAAGYEHP